ncbi:MAG: hypothetical protein KTR35_13535 [Gammaproteobacteria bacterium]|nr:hypothetical protein [Gammaproteobacteria bacterium]
MQKYLLSLSLGAMVFLAACSSDDDNASDESQFNPDAPETENTGEPGGDISAIAGLWDGTTPVADSSDVVYWYFAQNGVLTRYDYQQDGAPGATDENCYIVGDPITVTPEGGDDYSLFNVAVSAVRTDDQLTMTFYEADRNDLDADGDTEEVPTFTWSLLTTPVLEDLNACTE